MLHYVILTDSLADKDRYLAEFITLYKTIFSGKPFFEKFSDEDVTDIYNDYSQDGNLFILVLSDADVSTDIATNTATDTKPQLIGFSAGKPLMRCDSNIINTLADHLPVASAFYNADLGVLPAYRGNTIGSDMIHQRIDFAIQNNYSHVIMRTSEKASMSYSLYKKIGFDVIQGVYQDVQQERLHENIAHTDRRVFLCKKL